MGIISLFERINADTVYPLTAYEAPEPKTIMPKKQARKIIHVVRDRRLTPAEAAKYRDVREKVMKEFPPTKNPKLRPVKTGIGARIRAAREAKGLTWYALAKQAGIPNPGTVRDIEYGRDVRLSNLEAVARVLGLQVDLVGIH